VRLLLVVRYPDARDAQGHARAADIKKPISARPKQVFMSEGDGRI